MDSTDDNPLANVLPSGIAEDGLRSAIRKSGYPLQSVVARVLRDRGYHVQEEWGFRDREGDLDRSLDVYAERQLYDLSSIPRVRPSLSLLIECKQSELPYVFFSTSRPLYWPSSCPLVAGLKRSELKIHSDYEDECTFGFSVSTCLGLPQLSFLSSAPRYCSTFSKVARKGKNLELTGSEPFTSITLPLVKALDYFHCKSVPLKTCTHFDCVLALAVCVIDAPLLSVDSEAEGQEPSMVMAPWFRLLRHQVQMENENEHSRGQFIVIDLVHREFLAAYLDEWVGPFAGEFSRRVALHPDVLAECEGFVPQMYNTPDEDIVNRLKPYKETSNPGPLAGRLTPRA